MESKTDKVNKKLDIIYNDLLELINHFNQVGNDAETMQIFKIDKIAHLAHELQKIVRL